MGSVRVVDKSAAYRHEALLYEGRDGFLNGVLPFIREGVRAGEPVLVVVSEEKIAWLRDELGDEAGWVEFEDMGVVGRNPARLIAAWRGFTDAHADAPALRGIGEPMSPERSPEELDECRRHEALLNVAFDDDRDFWLLCPYDVAALSDGAADWARSTHPHVMKDGHAHASDSYVAPAGTLNGPLPRPPEDAAQLAFEGDRVRDVRGFVDAQVRALAADTSRAGDVVFAAGELAANSVRHGGGGGTVRVWRDPAGVTLEVRDTGVVADPMVGRLQPRVDQISGRGMWLVNQLCDLVQVRSGSGGTVVRVRVDDVKAATPEGVRQEHSSV